MVSNYFQDCKYLVNKLQPYVYLISEDALKDIKIDNGDAYISSITETPTRLDVYGLTLTEGDELDERYKFTHTLTFSVNGYANKDDFDGKYYIIVKDDDGTYWLINPLFPSKITYTYTLAFEENHTDFNVGTVSNHPVLRLLGMTDSQPYECKKYYLSGIDGLWLNEKRYTVHDGNAVKYTNGGFKTIEYNKKSAVFTEEFDGTKVSHSIDFNVLFSDYKSSWHYNLLEFKDNLYAAVIKTTDKKYALCGFGYGLQPSFTVNANDSETINYVEIKLQDSHDVGDTLYFYDDITYEYLSGKTWEYTSEYNGYQCVGAGTATYLLKKEVDALGNETGRFMVREGHRSEFPELDLVEEEFDDDVEFENMDCGSQDCIIETGLPSLINFHSAECKQYYLNSYSNWSITSNNSSITVSPSSGAAKTSYTISVCNNIVPSSAAVTSNLTLSYCNTTRTIDVVVSEDDDACLPQGATYNISANEQTLTIPTKCCVTSVKDVLNVGLNITVYESYISVIVPENNTGINRTITLLVVYCDGTSGNIIINQSNVFEKWEDDSVICKRKDKYKIQYLYTGSTSSSYTKTNRYREVLIEANSDDCHGTDDWDYFKYVIVDGYFCDDANKYALERKYVSDDGVNWAPTDIYRKSNTVIEYKSTDCCYDPKWEDYPYSKYEWDGETICNDGTKWKYYKKYFSMDGVVWEESCIYKLGTSLSDIVELNSEDCGYIPNGYMYRWHQSSVSDYICSGTTKYYKLIYQESRDSGTTWNNFIPLKIMLGDVIEYDSKECTINANKYKVVDTYNCEYYDETQVKDFRYKILDASGNTVAIQECNGDSVLKQADFSNYVNSSTTNEYTVVVGECIDIIYMDISGTDTNGQRNTFYYKDIEFPETSLVAIYRLGGLFGKHSFIIPKTVKILGDSLFYDGPNSSQSGTYKYNYRRITGIAFENDSRLEQMGKMFTLGNSIATELSGVTIPSGITEIPDTFCKGAKSLTSITIPKNVESIGISAFSGCSALTTVTFESGSKLKKIDSTAFYGCKSLSAITIPNNVEIIGPNAFSGCTSLSSVTFENNSSLKIISQAAFRGCAFSSMTIPQSVECIYSPFGATDGLIIIPQNSKIRRIVKANVGGSVPNEVEAIHIVNWGSAFGLTFPSTVKEIYSSDGITTASTITILAETPPYIELSSYFHGTIRVPSSSIQRYKTDAYWYQFSDYIVGI